MSKISDMKEKTVFSDTDLDRKQTIRRYLDLPKFVDLLSTNELHLEPAVNFDDHIEGTLPETVRPSFLENIPEKERNNRSIEELEYENKLRTNISCWTLGPEDNMALWKIYGGSSQSVSISTTIHNIISSAFSWCEEGKITLKKIRYINHSGKLPDGVYSLDEHVFGLKHEAYSFEREVRVVLTRPFGSPKKTLRLPIDVNTYITKITVSPESGIWFFDLVADLVKKYNVTVPVERSELSILMNSEKVRKRPSFEIRTK
jgi:hypothetical protein